MSSFQRQLSVTCYNIFPSGSLSLPPDDPPFQRKFNEEHKGDLKIKIRVSGFDNLDDDSEWGPKAVTFFCFYPDYGIFRKGRYHVGSNTWVMVAKMAFVTGGDNYLGGNQFLCLVLRLLDQRSDAYDRIGFAYYSTKFHTKDWFEGVQNAVVKVV